MSFLAFDRVSPPLGPEDVTFLRRLLEQLCDECHEDLEGTKAKSCAGTLVRTYQRGITDEDVLMDIGTAVLRS